MIPSTNPWHAVPHELRTRAIWCANGGAIKRVLALGDRAAKRAPLDEILAGGSTAEVAFELSPTLGLLVLTFIGAADPRRQAEVALLLYRLQSYAEVASNDQDIQVFIRHGGDFARPRRTELLLDGWPVRLSMGTELITCTGRHVAGSPRSIGSLRSRTAAELQGIEVCPSGGLVTRHVVPGPGAAPPGSFGHFGRDLRRLFVR